MNKRMGKDLSSKKILGMPVYSCTEGIYLGNIRNILIDTGSYTVLGFILERRKTAKDERILPFDAVHSFGEDGITVNGAAMLERIGQSSKYIRPMRHPLSIIGCRVFTTAGRTLGKAEEYRFDSISGKISGFEVSSDGFFRAKTLVKGEHLIAISGHTIMLQEGAADDAKNIENTFLSNMGNAAETVKEKAGELINKTKELSAGMKKKKDTADTDQQEKSVGNDADAEKSEETEIPDDELFVKEQTDGEVLMDTNDSLTKQSSN